MLGQADRPSSSHHRRDRDHPDDGRPADDHDHPEDDRGSLYDRRRERSPHSEPVSRFPPQEGGGRESSRDLREGETKTTKIQATSKQRKHRLRVSKESTAKHSSRYGCWHHLMNGSAAQLFNDTLRRSHYVDRACELTGWSPVGVLFVMLLGIAYLMLVGLTLLGAAVVAIGVIRPIWLSAGADIRSTQLGYCECRERHRVRRRNRDREREREREQEQGPEWEGGRETESDAECDCPGKLFDKEGELLSESGDKPNRMRPKRIFSDGECKWCVVQRYRELRSWNRYWIVWGISFLLGLTPVSSRDSQMTAIFKLVYICILQIWEMYWSSLFFRVSIRPVRRWYMDHTEHRASRLMAYCREEAWKRWSEWRQKRREAHERRIRSTRTLSTPSSSLISPSVPTTRMDPAGSGSLSPVSPVVSLLPSSTGAPSLSSRAAAAISALAGRQQPSSSLSPASHRRSRNHS